MRSLLSSDWPVSYMEQALFVQKIEAELERLEATQQSVVIYQATRPTQKEWEQGYVIQTGRPLPITPGSKLIWWDYRSGRAKLHTTSYDELSGTQSSGTVYEWSSIKRDQGPYRFLGASSGLGNMWNAQFKQVGDIQSSVAGTPAGSLILQPEFQSFQKLRAIELYFNLKYSSTAQLCLMLRQSRTFEDPNPGDGVSTVINNVFDEVISSGPAYTRAQRTFNPFSTSNDYVIELFDVNAAAQDADQRLFGKVTIHNIVDVTDEDNKFETVNIGNIAYQWEAYSFPSTGSADFEYIHGGGITRNSYPLSEGMGLFMYDTGGIATNQNPDSRIWAYGWYDTDYTINISPLGGFNDVP